MLENKKESAQLDFRLTVREKCIILPSWRYFLRKHVFSESQIIHECNRAPILLTDAVATKFSGCIHHFTMWGQSCTYHAEVYSPVLPQVLIQCMLIVTILHMRSNLMVSEWLRLTEHTHPENSTLAEVSAMQHLGQKTTLLMHAVITHLQFCCPEGSWAAPPKSLLHHCAWAIFTFPVRDEPQITTWLAGLQELSGLQLHLLFWQTVD